MSNSLVKIWICGFINSQKSSTYNSLKVETWIANLTVTALKQQFQR